MADFLANHTDSRDSLNEKITEITKNSKNLPFPSPGQDSSHLIYEEKVRYACDFIDEYGIVFLPFLLEL